MCCEDKDEQQFSKSENYQRAALLRELANFTIDWTRRFEEQLGSSPVDIVDPLHTDSEAAPKRSAQGVDRQQRAAVHLDAPANRAYARRRLRERVFAIEEIFGEPAWDILLDLASAREQGRKLTMSDACLGACVPMTTALRHVKILEVRGLVERKADPGDARRQFLVLTEVAAKKLDRYFQLAAQSRP